MRPERLLWMVVANALLAGCGSIGETRPPSLKIPARVVDLRAAEYGSKIIVDFTAPTMTTEGVALEDVPDFDLFIGDRRFRVRSADAHVRYEAPAQPFFSREVDVYLVAKNDRGRDAGRSNTVRLAVLPALQPPAEFRAEAVPNGVLLTWRSTGRKFRVYRAGPGEGPMAELALSDARTYTDVTAEFGKSYRYRVQEVAEAGTPPAVSELTEETAITPQDTFAPAAPTGLAAVVGTKSVELVWDRNSEPDVTGYRVYRAMEDGKPEVIGGEVPALAFSDTRIEAGKRYRYAVSALKKNGKESKLSEAIGITIP